MPEVSDDDSGANVVESRHDLLMKFAEGELVGRTVRGVSAASLAMVAADLDGTRFERVDLSACNLSRARLENATLLQVDFREGCWSGALWNRVHATTSDFTQIDLTAATLLRCELAEVRMPRALLRGAAVRGCRFTSVELARADLSSAVVTRCQFAGYSDGTASLSRVILAGAALIEVDLARVNLYAADLRGALLVRCDLRAANLCEADLRGARLVGCALDGADLEGAVL